MNGCEREVIIFVYTHLILDCYIDWLEPSSSFFLLSIEMQSISQPRHKKKGDASFSNFFDDVSYYTSYHLIMEISPVESNGPSTWRTINYHRQSIEMTCVDHIGSSRRPLTLLAINIFFKKIEDKKGKQIWRSFCVCLASIQSDSIAMAGKWARTIRSSPFLISIGTCYREEERPRLEKMSCG